MNNSERLKAWRKANPEKYKEQVRKYNEKNAGRIKEKRKKAYQLNKDKTNKTAQEWRDNNRDRIAAYNKERYYKNREDRINRTKEWKKNNPARNAYNSRSYAAAKLKATPLWITQDDIKKMQAVYEEANRLTTLTGIQFHVDHIIPLKGKTVCGLHVPNNLQVLPYYENTAKSNKMLWH